MRVFLPLWLTVLFLCCGISCAPLQVAEPLDPYSDLSGLFIASHSDVDTEDRPEIDYKPFPIDNNSYVKHWISRLSKKPLKDDMRRYLERSRRYIYFMGDILQEEGLPKDLVYMVMAESGFYPYAKSSANAVGYWQFIRPTGRQYGLRVDSYVDERQDVYLSTRAAIWYLKDLYAIFGDWRLSMAAYNCGENRVIRAIKKHKSKNFWRLVQRKALPPETRNYVPKIMAMKKIALKPRAYGFYNLDYKEPLEYDLISLRSPSSLSYISKELGIPYDDLKYLNSKFKTDKVPLEGEESYVRIPAYTEI